jgi:NitT/TauT family transport system ATP-binding protein
LWKSTGTTILFVTHNTHEALHLASRIVVLAKDSPDRGSRISLDLKIPDRLSDKEIPELVRRLESVSGSSEFDHVEESVTFDT